LGLGFKRNYKMDQVTRDAENERHCLNPEAGDYWSEHFCPYLLVLKVDGDKVYVLHGEDRIFVGADHWKWDITKYRIVDRAWLRNMVTYSTNSAFVADVLTGRCLDFIKEWKEYNVNKLKDAMKEFE
jgi:hypothetical protein